MKPLINNTVTSNFNQNNYLNQIVDLEIDTQGLNCPLPILKTKKALANMLSGQILRVTSTDLGAIRDFQVFTQQTGNILIGQYVDGTVCVHILQRK
jgi:tRNA 2-thiouridine synthesizing protein A